MRNKEFDEYILRRIQTEHVSMKKETEMHTQRKIQENQRKKTSALRHPLRVAVVVLVALLCVAGTVFATLQWNSRDVITHTDRDGQEYINEALATHAQPIAQFFYSETLAVDIIDAIFDGKTMVLAWTLTNTSEKELYLLCETLANDNPPGIGYSNRTNEVLVQPGETVEAGFSAEVEGDAAECTVRMRFIAMIPQGEVVAIGGISEDTDIDDYHDHIETLIEEGKVPMEPDGMIATGAYRGDPEKSITENLEGSGLMRKTDELVAEFTVGNNVPHQPFTWQATENDNGEYILRVAQADIFLNSAIFRLEMVFDDRDAAENFDYDGTGLRFDFLDGADDPYHWYNIASGDFDDAPEEQVDGTWTLGFTWEMTNLTRVPTAITIIPQRKDPENPIRLNSFPDERVKIRFK